LRAQTHPKEERRRLSWPPLMKVNIRFRPSVVDRMKRELAAVFIIPWLTGTIRAEGIENILEKILFLQVKKNAGKVHEVFSIK